MADRVTQIQDALDQLATQFYASLRYVLAHHNTSVISTQPTQPLSASDPQYQGQQPDSPAVFASALTELSRDLIVKEQQIEYLVSVLPGIGSSSATQEARLKELESELRRAEQEKEGAVRERDKMVERVEDLLMKVKKT
ncbi:MAG: RNA polymerase II mediator complex subunit [Vezdaea aestivalis]|nr:MAG: RNA polymerase II mediator complex subunit [Vezdaea aestivalis]